MNTKLASSFGASKTIRCLKLYAVITVYNSKIFINNSFQREGIKLATVLLQPRAYAPRKPYLTYYLTFFLH